jgi:hypothetical protein
MLFLVLFAMQKEKLLLIAIPVIFLLPVILSAGITQHFRTLTEYPLDQGEPTSAVVAMGMQEGVWNAGWFNGYNFQLYGQNNFESKATDKAAKDYIHQRIQEFKANPDMARDFYHRKVLSQWNCPDYEVFVASREVKNDPTGLIEKIQKGNLHSGILAFLNGYQLILYLGMLFASLAAIFWSRQVENVLFIDKHRCIFIQHSLGSKNQISDSDATLYGDYFDNRMVLPATGNFWTGIWQKVLRQACCTKTE